MSKVSDEDQSRILKARDIVFNKLQKEIVLPQDYENLCHLAIVELTEGDPKWKEVTEPYRTHNIPHYHAIYKCFSNKLNKHLNKVNKKIRERLGAANDRTDSEQEQDQEEDLMDSQPAEQVQPSEGEKHPDDSGPATTSTTKQPATIDPEAFLLEPKNRKQGLILVGDEAYRCTSDGIVDQKLLWIRDAYKMRKRYLKEARKVEESLNVLCNEMQSYICGFDVFTESDLTE